MTAPPPDVRSLFTAPFKTDTALTGATNRRALRLYDGNMDTVATRHMETGKATPRGYGRHRYLPNGDARHDAWCAWFRENIPTDATLDDVARLLNEAWEVNDG